ncbi:MAG: site-specific integrase [Phycisphaerales bacterium]|nr:site-specific integrase [Phycisphaerales bacterium]
MVNRDRVNELTAAAIQGALAKIHADGLSLQTCQHYLRAVKQFTRWLTREGRIEDDVLSHLSGFNTATDWRRERRAMTGDELRQLVGCVKSSATWRGMGGADRGMLYRVACGTGYRAGELRSLSRRSFHLDSDPPTVTLDARHSKRRRADRQPIRSDLAEVLGAWLADKPGEGPVFAIPDKTAMMIRRDLRRARAAWVRTVSDRSERRVRLQRDFLAEVDADGRVLDFHSLRVTYITLVVKGGASVRVAQELARHSDPKLTMNVYSKLGVHDLTGALAGLPSVRPDRDDTVNALRATGTYATHPPQLSPQLGHETPRRRATACDENRSGSGNAGGRKSLSNAKLRESERQGAALRPAGVEPATPGLGNR